MEVRSSSLAFGLVQSSVQAFGSVVVAVAVVVVVAHHWVQNFVPALVEVSVHAFLEACGWVDDVWALQTNY